MRSSASRCIGNVKIFKPNIWICDNLIKLDLMGILLSIPIDSVYAQLFTVLWWRLRCIILSNCMKSIGEVHMY